MVTEALRSEVLRTLDDIKDPCSVGFGEPMGLVEMGLIRSVEISPKGDVSVCLRLTSPFCEMIGFFKTAAVEKLQNLPSVGSVAVEADSGFDWSPEYMSPLRQQQRRERLGALREASRPGGLQLLQVSDPREFS
jgi:metal-sulfur cluster biosynthetic enzyme